MDPSMDDGGAPPKPRASRRRPPRASRACETCRLRKTKCDQNQPCSYCAYHSLDCIYRAAAANESSAAAGKRHAHIREIQRNNKTRPSPWPEVNGTPQRSQHESNAADTLINLQQSQSPGMLHGGTPRTTADNTGTPVHLGKGEADSQNGIIVGTPELGDSASREGLSGVNLHTNGTEFYGNSSNLAFLGNLYARARNQAENKTSNISEDAYLSGPSPLETSTMNQQSNNTVPASDKGQLSIVNLLYNPSYPSHSPPSQQHGSEQDKGRGLQTQNQGNTQRIVLDQQHGVASVIDQLSDEAQLEIEKMFITSYFSNKHYIHPMLCKSNFMRRCEIEAFVLSRRPAFSRGSSKFAGLYFAVVALGAINASPNETSLLDHYCTYSPDPRKSGTAAGYSGLGFANYYFGMAKQALGDLFESSCLESAQTLLLLSVFCQNALRPHSCFMYSGMAVRTAVAIGLASGMSSMSPSIRKEGRRTWWCIYSHEVEMCCSSGRLDSMKELHYYQVPLPTLKTNCIDDPEAEDNDIAMIPVMVSLAQIMSEASHHLYHSTKRSMNEMSQIAMSLDRKLSEWKSNIPSFLSIDSAALNDPEWAFKQKLVLRLRFYNTRILIHRPFLVTSTSPTESSKFLSHLHICLEAARTSIQMQYESFLHRIYIRTWWYNTTYALYGSMILLHLVLSNFAGIPDEEILADVEKSLEIFESMDNIIVARRCAEMIRGVLEVAKACLARRPATHTATNTNTNTSAAAAAAAAPAFPISTGASSFHPQNHAGTVNGLMNSGTDEDFFFSLFSQDSQPDTRAEILANLVDPTILEDFAFGSGGNDFSYFLES